MLLFVLVCLLQADNIVVVGSGPVGCEFSGEILRKFPKKKVTLISRSAFNEITLTFALLVLSTIVAGAFA